MLTCGTPIEYENGLTKTPSPPDVIVVPRGTYNLGPAATARVTIRQSLVILGGGARTTTVDVAGPAQTRAGYSISRPL